MTQNLQTMRQLTSQMADLLALSHESTAEALTITRREDQNMLVGTLMPVRAQLEAALQILNTIETLHRLPTTMVPA